MPNVDRHNFEEGLYLFMGLIPIASNPDAGAGSGVANLWIDKATGKLNYKDPTGTNHVLPLTEADDTLVAHLAGVETFSGIKTFASDAHVVGMFYEGVGAALVVTANVVAPTSPIHHCGAGLIKTITVPPGSLAGQSPTVTLIPDSAFTYDATGNIVVPAGSGTAIVNRAMSFSYDPGTSKWYPSY